MHRILVLLVLCTLTLSLAAQSPGTAVEYDVRYPNATTAETGACHPAPKGSTHEITFNPKGGGDLWITGQNYDQVVKVGMDGSMTFHPMPAGSRPHGIEFDGEQRLWVSLEFAGQIVRLDANGKIQQTIDVGLDCPTCADGKKINPYPHGLWFGADGKTIWFTGKGTGTIGKVAPDGKMTTYQLKTVGSVPIYIRPGNDGTMWATELVGNAIVRIGTDGRLTEIPIPTYNSRPIAIVPEPGSNAMWFSEEAGNRIGRVTPDGTITEYQLPMTQPNIILAALAFDRDGNLWVQQYVNQNSPTPSNPSPAGGDYILRIDKSILTTAPADISRVPMTYYRVPSTQTVMHRILQGPDGNIWFTELGVNKVGKLTR